MFGGGRGVISQLGVYTPHRGGGKNITGRDVSDHH